MHERAIGLCAPPNALWHAQRICNYRLHREHAGSATQEGAKGASVHADERTGHCGPSACPRARTRLPGTASSSSAPASLIDR
jgi:hypothetical protein